MYRRQYKGWIRHWDFILLDILVQQLSFIIAYMIWNLTFRLPYQDKGYLQICILAALLNALVAIDGNTMRNVLRRGLWDEAKTTARQVMYTAGLLSILVFVFKTGEAYSRFILLFAYGLHFVLGYGTRRLYRDIFNKKGKARARTAILIVAEEKGSEEIVRRLSAHLNKRFTIAGLVLTDCDAKGKSVAGVPIVANLADTAGYICREWIDEVFVSVTRFDEPINDLLRKCQEMAVPAHVHISFDNSYNAKQFVEQVGDYDVITSCVTAASPLALTVKRMMDIVGGLIGSLGALLVLAVVGPMIKHTSPGPVLYMSERIGRNGKRFRMYKLRSMYPDADQRKQELMSQNRVTDGMMFKVDFDPRVIGNEILPDGTKKTGIGDFIRRTSLDEFPQFFNVLKGDMSLVGTRPPTPDEWERYQYHHRARLATKPGITGMWQVSGRSEITDFEEVVKLDTEYLNTWSIGKDIKILFQTVIAVIRRKGAM